jgi:hypothetical protein
MIAKSSSRGTSQRNLHPYISSNITPSSSIAARHVRKNVGIAAVTGTSWNGDGSLRDAYNQQADIAVPGMAQSFDCDLQLIEVTTDEFVSGLPTIQVWVAAAKPEQAITLVLTAVPEGWTAVISDVRLEPEEAALLKMQPGEVRELEG